VTSKASGKNFLACHTAGTKGGPSFVRIYEYPKFDGQALANKSFYKADNVAFLWSPKGEQVLLICTTDVDKSGKSYYGEQLIHFMDVRGGTFAVTLNKEGPIHNTAWAPNPDKEQQFCIIYGHVPAKVSLFNCKGDLVQDLGEPANVNLIAFNPVGNLLALAGFGNLRGGVHVWDFERKKKICHFDCPETTDLTWSPDGTKILTSTTAPRLRVGNGFKVWRYIGTKAFEDTFPNKAEMYKVQWQPRPGHFSEPVIKDITQNPKQVVKEAPKPQKYIPPSARGHMNMLSSGKAAALNAVKGARNAAAPAKPVVSEHDKRIKKAEKALDAIKKLKQEQASGKVLEKNQLDKISKEKELLAELDDLRISGDI
jgi:translation initiation factor 2A